MKERKRKLSERDIKVLVYISQGYTDLDIANDFKISATRTRSIITRLMDVTGAVNRAQLVYRAVKEGLIK